MSNVEHVNFWGFFGGCSREIFQVILLIPFVYSVKARPHTCPKVLM